MTPGKADMNTSYITITSKNSRDFIDAIHSFLESGYVVTKITYSRRYVFFTTYYAWLVKKAPKQILDINIGPVSVRSQT